MIQYEWRHGRCPCCFKKTEIVLGPILNETARGWDNAISRAHAERLARAGTCPWCGRETTIVARTLLSRFKPTADAVAREMCW